MIWWMRWRIGGLMNWLINYVLSISCYTSIRDKFDMGIFMSKQPIEFPPLEDVLKRFNTSIDNGTFTYKDLEGVKFLRGNQKSINLALEDIEKLVNHALVNKKFNVVDLIACEHSQATAEKFQLAKLKAEIEDGKTPDIAGQFTCIQRHQEDRGEVGGYMSAPQDHERREIVEIEEKVPFQLSGKNQVTLVDYALEKKKPEIAKQLVVKLSDDDLKKFSKREELGETVSEETKKRLEKAQKKQLLDELDSLKIQIEELKKGYDERGSLSKLLNPSTADKIKEAADMLTEITRLKDLLHNKQNNNSAWKFDGEKTALSDKKTLHGYAVKLQTLKTSVEKPQPALSAVPARSK